MYKLTYTLMFPNTSNELLERIEEICYIRKRLDLVWQNKLDCSSWNRELEDLVPLPPQCRTFFHHEQAGIHFLPPGGSIYASIILKYQPKENYRSFDDEFKLPNKKHIYYVGIKTLEKKEMPMNISYDLYYKGQKSKISRNKKLSQGQGENILVLLQTKISFFILGIYRLEKTMKKNEDYSFCFQRV